MLLEAVVFPFGRTCVEVFISSGSELLFGVVVLFSFSFVRLFGKILIVIGSTHACYVCRKCLELFNVLNKRSAVYSCRFLFFFVVFVWCVKI